MVFKMHYLYTSGVGLLSGLKIDLKIAGFFCTKKMTKLCLYFYNSFEILIFLHICLQGKK